MSQRQIRIQLLYLFLAIGCAAVLTAGCDAPVGDSEIDPIRQEEVDTEYSDSMFDHGTPLNETSPLDDPVSENGPADETWASPGEGEKAKSDAENEHPPVKPTFHSNAGTGSSDQADESSADEDTTGN
ncbi:membrane or secreted protein [Aporhodopirellula aestuarii]|uniref:Membrane or secreted protein n=1 Tax=Aporhodopirellula aestuarii TaxID=2950107 RepID=A0ABT0U1V4_9BACT|nr:membrane or secreted protein [Aporhodopirellula aestuarii]MCM2370880.1 membrane or secreted protein [Aporhodopirellula aestuarii]